MSRCAVVTCSDTNMIPAACCALLSAARHSGGIDARYLLVGVGLRQQDIETVKTFGQDAGITIEVIPFDGSIRLPETPGRWPQSALARLFVDELLPRDIDRLLYLDADVLVLTPLAPLWRFDLGANMLGAVEDYLMAFPEKAGRRAARLGLAHGPPYFNSGVLLFDWPACIEGGLMAQARAILFKGEREFDATDQDVLNIAFQGRWLPIDLRWNVQTGMIPFIPQPAIVHFTGRRKPWHASINWRHRDFARQYHEMLAGTPWRDFTARRSVAQNIEDFVLSCGARLGNMKRNARARAHFGRKSAQTTN